MFIRLWTVLSLNPVYKIRDFFISPGTKDIKKDFLWDPLYLGNSMSRTRFGKMHQSTRLQNEEPPTDYCNRFLHVQKLLDSFNEKTESAFGPSWITCLDASIVISCNAFCPGYLNVKRKSYPFGNKYSTIASCKTYIIFFVALVVVKDYQTVGPHSSIGYTAE